MDRLWKDIGLVYEYYKKKSCKNLNIISCDNYYSIDHLDDEKNMYLYITKEYNLVNMWNDGGNPVSYTIEVSIQYIDVYGQNATIPIQGDKLCIEKAYDLLKPYLREVKLEELGI